MRKILVKITQTTVETLMLHHGEAFFQFIPNQQGKFIKIAHVRIVMEFVMVLHGWLK
jgi:hypothetical protein